VGSWFEKYNEKSSQIIKDDIAYALLWVYFMLYKHALLISYVFIPLEYKKIVIQDSSDSLIPILPLVDPSSPSVCYLLLAEIYEKCTYSYARINEKDLERKTRFNIKNAYELTFLRQHPPPAPRCNQMIQISYA
jgi:hypothetical protein